MANLRIRDLPDGAPASTDRIAIDNGTTRSTEIGPKVSALIQELADALIIADVTGLQAALDAKIATSAIGSTVQGYDADLAAIAALVSAANKIPYSTGAQTWALADFTAAGRAMVAALTADAQTALLSNFIASGASHAKGLVPTPGASAGTTRFLREDATWATTPSAGARNIVQTIKTDTFTTASTSFVDVTGASVTITPTSATSKVLVRVSGVISNATASGGAFVKLVRGSTDIAIGDAAGSRIRASAGQRSPAEEADNIGLAYVDSPATTSATTYKIQIVCSAGTATVGRHGTDADTSGYARYPTILIVEEILQ